jgi:hypothetical protein
MSPCQHVIGGPIAVVGAIIWPGPGIKQIRPEAKPTRSSQPSQVRRREPAMSGAQLIAWAAAELYAIRAIVIYWRLRTRQMPQESDELRWHIGCTPALRPVVPAILCALPVIAELTCMVNGLLWGLELLTRPWRT